MACNLGLDSKLYYDVDGTLALATWVELDLARDVNTSASAAEAEQSDRRTNFVMTCPALLSLETSATFTYENGDANLTALRDAFINRTSILLAVVDGNIATSGTEGFVYYAHVYSNDFNQPLTEGATVEVTFKPTTPPSTDPTVYPQWYVVP